MPYSLSQPPAARRAAHPASEAGPPAFSALEGLLYQWLELSEAARIAVERDDEDGLLRALAARDELMGRVQAVLLTHPTEDPAALAELVTAVEAADARLLERMRQSQARLAEELDQMEPVEVTTAGYGAGAGQASASTFEFVR